MFTVYNYLNQVMFEGTEKMCLEWIMNQATEKYNGKVIYRTWQEDLYNYYDVGRVYHMRVSKKAGSLICSSARAKI